MRREDIRRQMTALVRRWGASGEPQAEFARRHGVSAAKLRYWVARVPPAAADTVTFTPVQVRDVGRPEVGGTIEVALTTGERLVIAAGASADLVRAVVAALRATC